MNAHAQSIADATRIDGVIVARDEVPAKRPDDHRGGIAFGMMLASTYAARSAIASVESAVGFIKRAVQDGAGSDLDVHALRGLSEDLVRLAAEADAVQAVIADRIARGRP